MAALPGGFLTGSNISVSAAAMPSDPPIWRMLLTAAGTQPTEPFTAESRRWCRRRS
jgi:hypothetical protein